LLGRRPAAGRRGARADDCAVVRATGGAGVRRRLHEEPQLPKFAERGAGPDLAEGMVLAVQPMVNAGTHGIRVAEDNWSVYSQDGSLAAHFEHTVAIMGDGPRILTPWHLDEARKPARAARAAPQPA